ncbi:hypothetical protein ACWDT5_22160 [Rhodococcus aetherivorans]
MTLLDQLPHFSQYDPGAEGEGSLDPLGLGSVAERIAHHLVPALRARMAQPRFVTLAGVGAFACQQLVDVVSSDGKTRPDIAFEWILVEALVRHADPDAIRGLPGIQKARRAQRAKERLGPSTYLSGPRVFGFTGVYRPFSVASEVLTKEGLPSEAAYRLVRAWEIDHDVSGFIDGAYRSDGDKLRREIEREVQRALAANHSVAPPTGWLMRRLAGILAPGGVRARERAELRNLVTATGHPIHDELAALLRTDMPVSDAPQQVVVENLLPRASAPTRVALDAVIKFERCATAIEYAYRRLLAYAASLGGAFSVEQGCETPLIADTAAQLEELTARAIEAVAALDEQLASDVSQVLSRFDRKLTPSEFVTSLILRHQEVQDAKHKRMWLDHLNNRWVVRPPYRNQSLELDNAYWTHPMRVNTLATFVRETM